MTGGYTDTVSPLQPSRVAGYVEGYPAATGDASHQTYAALTADYAAEQQRGNGERTRAFLHPILQRLGAHSVLDAGCGVGTMVSALLDLGYDAHGFDLIENVPHWSAQGLPTGHLVVTDALRLALPYDDAAFDAVFSFGVIEHVGTTDGNATRRSDYHAVRRQWTRELFRVVRPGGHMLLAGPNKGFPVDTAHGLDADAGWLEHRLSGLLRVSVHRPWGANFLWSYGDVEHYLEGLPHNTQGLSVEGMANFSRVPGPFKALAEAYVAHLPRFLLNTGFNPWMMALVQRHG